ncbi:MAG: radical SAM protein [Desulfomonile tiedjei]|uniref:Radical SAM protein n=1 Tax=Desulfomonile tiedjei TaxID=2358 RepID=A0A9D6UYU8_9BACT|nr:radical SAM protein [Desulfomonile tiedjei]
MTFRLNPDEIRLRAAAARSLSSPCKLCPRKCGVDRPSGQRGYCGAGPVPQVASVIPHFGEEPPLIVGGGAGTIFFSRCNLSCVFCQNHQISQAGIGSLITAEELASKILDLQNEGCCNIEPVSPGHHLPGLLAALAVASDQGLGLPIVYNTNGYETPEALDILDGIVDVYLPDLKYSSDEEAMRYSDAADYVATARSAILKMHSQVGDMVLDEDGRAVRGLILRLLVLPGNVSGTLENLTWIRENLPPSVTISLMAQYAPLHRASQDPLLNRRITEEEYDRILDFAWDMGFENAFIQDLESQESGIPDFRSVKPFEWD